LCMGIMLKINGILLEQLSYIWFLMTYHLIFMT
jgi:hypothetical protein